MGIVEWIIIAIVIAFLINRFMPVKGISNIDVNEAKKKMKDKKVQFIDVRTPGEYKANHAKPFKNYPLFSLKKDLSSLDQENEVVVICQSGMRSTKAAKLLKKNGFSHVYNVQGGMNRW
uniref:rhodanese-like domain-containing protein n=1 Tax=uncultured Allobacillus sp. TaxID=1638025 RepID=UPI002599D789|nr:rhodanese-like domain-containing protein [uncultured Allobacillus sp.]